MKFTLLRIFTLSLNNQIVPLYGSVEGKRYPETIPFTLVALCFTNSLVKLLIPLILEETYSSIYVLNTDPTHYIILIALVITAIAFSQFIMIIYGLVLTLYRLNVKRQLSMRILHTNFKDYKSLLQSLSIDNHPNTFKMDLRMKISTKVSVYLHNYYQSYLSLIFQCFNIVVIFIYLLYKLSFSLFFGVAIAGLVMYKTISISSEMQNIRFDNIEQRAKRLKILQQFFNRIAEYKMCWLDQWIHNKIKNLQDHYQQGLRKIKMLDCWCVALWQFTSIGISGIVITAYFLLGYNQQNNSETVISPSTFVYLLGMLNYPLNALSWYIAGIKTARRAIEELKNDIRVDVPLEQNTHKIQNHKNSLIISKPIQFQLNYQGENNKMKHNIKLAIQQIPKNTIISVKGSQAQHFMDKLIFLFQDKTSKGFVEQNAWLSATPLEAITMHPNLTQLSEPKSEEICRLMELFCCSDIPLNTNTKHYSGGQKLRISLVRAFYLGQVIIINSDLSSLDENTNAKVKENIHRLVRRSFLQIKKEYTVFIRGNQEIADYLLSLNESQNHLQTSLSKLDNHCHFGYQKIDRVLLSPAIRKYKQDYTISIISAKNRSLQKKEKYSIDQLQKDRKTDEKSVVSLSTFKLYYKSKKHIIFLISIIAMTSLSNYYNYYINTYISLANYQHEQVLFIGGLTLLFAITLFFRSYYFADANLEESKRLCSNLNKNIIMNQLSNYQSQPDASEQAQETNSKSRLVCALTSDTQTIADHFPFSTNIFANNIVITLSSMAIIIIQVPPMLIIVFFLVVYSFQLNKISHRKDQFLKIAMKQKDVEIYRIMAEIQDGKKYLLIHNRLSAYTQSFVKHNEELYSIDWLNQKFKYYINFKYKAVMVGFLIVAVSMYSFMNVFSQHDLISSQGSSENKSSSGLALLIQYTTQLSNYLLFFTMSIWEIKGQAVSLQRVKQFIDQTPEIRSRINASQTIIGKTKENKQLQIKEGQPLIKFEDLNFAYQSNPNANIFYNFSFTIRKGDKIKIKGRSGGGKTSLYKLLTSAYPHILNTVDLPFLISYSPQHPLLLPDTQTIEENINPYKINYNHTQIEQYLKKHHLESTKAIADLNYEQKIIINNLRAYIYGAQGIVLYDQPQLVVERSDLTYLIITHHQEFNHNLSLQMQDGKLVPN